MSWNGSGVFNRIYSWVADKNAGIDITASRMDADTNDITSNGFGNTLTRDGQGSASANLPMNNFRHTGVGNAQARTDYAALGQVQDGVALNWTTAAGTADAITVTYTPAITALVDGQLCFVRASGANTTTTPTFGPNGLTVHTITKAGGTALAVGDIPGALAEIILRYNLANTRWELLNPANGTGTITTAMIAANAVTLAKMATQANNTILGNGSGGAAIPAALTVTGPTMTATTAAFPFPPTASFKNLSIKVASNTTVAVAADYVAVTDGSGAFQTLAFSSTINLGTTGANALDTGTIAIDTWYAIWAIAKADGTAASLASTSFTAPTMPNGYTQKARIGAVRTIHASATLYGTWQFGRRAQYVVGLAQTTALPTIVSGSTGSYTTTTFSGTSTSVAAFVPTTASRIAFFLSTEGNAQAVALAPNNSYSGFNGLNAVPWSGNSTQTGYYIQGEFLLESANVFFAGGANAHAQCVGWEDNI